MVLRAMVLGWLDGFFTSIHERVLYPSHRLGGEGNDIVRGRKPPPPLFYSLFYSVATGYPSTLSEHPLCRKPRLPGILNLGFSVNGGNLPTP